MNREDWIGAYLAGVLQGAKLKKFEDQLENDPTLRIEVDAVRSFVDRIDNTQDFPKVLEMIKEVDHAAHQQVSKNRLAYIIALAVGVVLFIIVLFLMLDDPDEDSLPSEDSIKTNMVFAANFNEFISKKYDDNTQFLDPNNNRGEGATVIDSSLEAVFKEVSIAAKKGDWREVDRLLSEEIENDRRTNYEKDAIKFIGGIARLQIDSCDRSGKQRLVSIPEREFYSFFSVSQEIVNRIEKIDCQKNTQE